MVILLFGDIVGKPGRQAIAKILPELRAKHHPDLVVANVENVAHGKGITMQTINPLLEAGVNFFTSGNHVFDKPGTGAEVFEKLADKIIRPANFPPNLPGKGYAIITIKGQPVLVINLNGQVFMERQFDFGEIANPFEKLNEILKAEAGTAKIKILDFHAEATSEKRAMGFWADGRLSAVVGTHTHVATADAQVLTSGTGYVTDLGMVGAAESVIGVDKEMVLKRFLVAEEKQKKIPFEVADTGKFEIGYAVLEIDEVSGKCKNIVSELRITWNKRSLGQELF